MTPERFADFLILVSRNEEGRSFAAAGIVAAFVAEDIGSSIVIDPRGPSDGAWFNVHVDDENAPLAEVTFTGHAATFDSILRGDLSIMHAIAARKIVAEGTTRGAVPRAMRLVPAFQRSLSHYR